MSLHAWKVLHRALYDDDEVGLPLQNTVSQGYESRHLLEDEDEDEDVSPSAKVSVGEDNDSLHVEEPTYSINENKL